jgi:hypothetical protein
MWRPALGCVQPDPALELSAALHHLEVKAAVLIALLLSEREFLLELIETKCELRVGHTIFLILSRSPVNPK